MEKYRKRTTPTFFKDLNKKMNMAYMNKSLIELQKIKDFIIQLETNAIEQRIPQDIDNLFRLYVEIGKREDQLISSLNKQQTELTYFTIFLNNV